MALARVRCRAEHGLAAPPVGVEVHVGAGLPSFFIVGLAAAVVRESKERVRAAVQNAGFEFPAGRITVSLSPAELPKEGGRYDLPIALGLLIASGQLVPAARFAAEEYYGELGLSGELRPVRGLLLATLAAAQAGHGCIVPAGNAGELRGSPGALHAAPDLAAVCDHVRARSSLPRIGDAAPSGAIMAAGESGGDLADVRGQPAATAALVAAAAGGHSLLLVGSPGVGKSMLAQRLPGILPPTTPQEQLEIATIAAASRMGAPQPGRRPFRAPHHTISTAALIGGGPLAAPGEVSLAHHGVLFLDELPEFQRPALESLREPLETGTVTVARAARHVTYPARFQLIAAMNPCPCGLRGDILGGCRCSAVAVARYQARLSGPLLDRIDLIVPLPRPDPDHLRANGHSARGITTSASARRAVSRARSRQLERQGVCNALLSDAALAVHCPLDEDGEDVLRRRAAQRPFSARVRARILRLARTLADLEGTPEIRPAHVAGALACRRLPADADADAPGAISAPALPGSRRPA